MRTIKENSEALIVANKEIGIDVNVDKRKCIDMSRDQNAGKNHTLGTPMLTITISRMWNR